MSLLVGFPRHLVALQHRASLHFQSRRNTALKLPSFRLARLCSSLACPPLAQPLPLAPLSPPTPVEFGLLSDKIREIDKSIKAIEFILLSGADVVNSDLDDGSKALVIKYLVMYNGIDNQLQRQNLQESKVAYQREKAALQEKEVLLLKEAAARGLELGISALYLYSSFS
jgi:hypothetical protein